MDFREVLRRRGAVHNFLDRPLDAGAVERILECGRHGPSAGFTEGFELLVLEGADQIQRHWATMAAPLVIVALAHRQAYLDRYAEPDKGWTDKDEARWPVPYWMVDASFAAQLMMLAAIDEGLATGFVEIDDVGGFREAFSVPAEYFPIGAVAIGLRSAST